MDIAAIKAHLARDTYWLELGDFEFHIEMPSRLEMMQTLGQAAPDGRLVGLEMTQSMYLDMSVPMALRHVIGWKNVTVGDIVPGAALSAEQKVEMAPFDKELLSALIHNVPGVALFITSDIQARAKARAEQEEVETKNS